MKTRYRIHDRCKRMETHAYSIWNYLDELEALIPEDYKEHRELIEASRRLIDELYIKIALLMEIT